MSIRCQPGDLAIVVEAQNSSNIGLIVRVQGPYAHAGASTFADSGALWQCECAHPMTWVRRGRTITAYSGPIPDALLQPIRGLTPRSVGQGAAAPLPGQTTTAMVGHQPWALKPAAE